MHFHECTQGAAGLTGYYTVGELHSHGAGVAVSALLFTGSGGNAVTQLLRVSTSN